MIDIDKLEALAKDASETGIAGHRIKFFMNIEPESVLALIAEVRALRETLSTPIAWRCDWNGKDGTGVWHQYHDAEDPLPESWDDEVPMITPLYAAKEKP
ncbi:hypothetical protein [Paraburkholderia graminis]|uniref:hypothetical protein n=1 Tax=Paraburkholderia graminis TaxID=60548 RepID=UPI0038BD683B